MWCCKSKLQVDCHICYCCCQFKWWGHWLFQSLTRALHVCTWAKAGALPMAWHACDYVYRIGYRVTIPPCQYTYLLSFPPSPKLNYQISSLNSSAFKNRQVRSKKGGGGGKWGIEVLHGNIMHVHYCHFYGFWSAYVGMCLCVTLRHGYSPSPAVG